MPSRYEGGDVKELRAHAAGLVMASVLLSGVPFAPVAHCPQFEIQSVYAEDDWKKEFEEICSRTDDAMSFSKEQLKDLIARCDKLKPTIGALDESTKKVYLRRLQMCRDFLAFVLESKEKI